MKKLIEGLHEFQQGYFSHHKDLFENLAHGQHPRILFITCSDSRIDPNLITQAQVGDLFVIRNAGNIIPAYRAANGGEGASIEYALQALNIEQIIVCGHSHCGAIKGLLKLSSLEDKMPLVYDWLKHAEATRRLVLDNYSHYEGEQLIEITVAENVLTQLENLQTYPLVRSRLHQCKLTLHGWIYRIESGEVLEYDGVSHDFVPPHSRLIPPESEYTLHPACPIANPKPYSAPESSTSSQKRSLNGAAAASHLSPEQANRIYRGSYR